MAAFAQLFLAYFLGGVTLLPALLGIIFCHAYFLLPRTDSARKSPSSVVADDDAGDDEKLKEQLLHRNHEPDAAAGYFAVCREYVPRGVNGKPPERTTPAGETIATESPSVYQSMYRSIFERGKTQSPSIESGKVVKKAKNVFYIVLRHAHLLLFDNSEQLEVRHVISLAYYDIDVYAGGDSISEGELWIKRNCIRLTKRAGAPGASTASMPFYLFSDNCSEKEDFYHCLLRNQEPQPDSAEPPPSPLMFETEDMIKLIRQLHVSEESSQTRWLNALIGRLFLALYKTSEVEALVRKKITRKMSRVPKPAFITSLNLEEVDMGHTAPVLTNFKLREMTVDGALTIEADLKYNGNFKLVTSAVARIALGSRFKPREVNLVLAGIFKRVEGHLLVHFKPPPSNRIWLSFETMPKLEISLEPIVSSRQITYGVILRALESRVREVFNDTLVYPNWDDSPFTNTQSKRYRGGIWQDEEVSKPLSDTKENEKGAHEAQNDRTDQFTGEDEPQSPNLAYQDQEKSVSMPDLSESPLNRGKRYNSPLADAESMKSEDDISNAEPRHKNDISEKPKVLRKHSFATAADPIVSKGPSSIDATRRPVSRRTTQDATSAMKILSGMSPESSPRQSPVGSPVNEGSPIKRRTSSGASARGALDGFNDEQKATMGGARSRTWSASSTGLTGSQNTPTRSESDTVDSPLSLTSKEKPSSTPRSARSLPRPINADRKTALNQSITSATIAAKNWGWGVINRQQERKDSLGTTKEPLGRGQPLPPPGVPLPRPSGWSAGSFGSLRRKPVPSAATVAARAATDSSLANSSSSSIATNPDMITSTDQHGGVKTNGNEETDPEKREKTSTFSTEAKGDDSKQDSPDHASDIVLDEDQDIILADYDVDGGGDQDELQPVDSSEVAVTLPDSDQDVALDARETATSPLWDNEYIQAS